MTQPSLPGLPDADDGDRPPELPRPRRGRWQPLRSGFVNLYRFDYEEFRYEEGRLLLRGHNGTGKSRVLALQLPFLLDGETASHRLEPDGDPAKRIEWNLLMGKHEDRLGYTWLELGRADDEGREHFLTLGCGLQAVAGRSGVNRWFFVTDQRIGRDLLLHTPTGVALSRPRLMEAIGERGEVYTTAERYRRAVDHRLFHLGEARYKALVDLLIQLRQPQLSRKLDEEKLSRALSEALPPLSPGLLDDVADAFRGLESDQLAVENLEASLRAVEEFLKSYARYAQIAGRRRAEQVRTAHSAFEATARRLRKAEERRDEEALRLAAAREELERLRLATEEADTTVRTLEQSPEMRDKKALDEAVRRAEERRAELERAGAELEDARGRHEGARREEETAAAAAVRTLEEAERRLAQALDDAHAAGLDAEHRAAVERLGFPEEADPERLRGLSERLDEAADRRRRASRHVAALAQALTAAEGELTHARRRHEEREAELDDALERQRRARDAFDEALDAVAAAYRAWTLDVRELAPADAGEVAAALADWGRTADGESPVEHAVREAGAAAFERLALERAELEGRREELRAELDELQAEAERWRSGVHVPPPAPPTRDVEARERRDGAPLWRLVDFAPGVGEKERAGVEAALEASGLLDAWLTADGRLLDAGDHDVVLLAEGDALPEGELSLLYVLDPSPPGEAGEPSAAQVEAVLGRIGYGPGGGERGPGSVWVDAEGRFQLGPLHGVWSKPAAQHVGESAREAERRRRLEELLRQIEAAEHRRSDVEAQLVVQADRERRARRELGEAPAMQGVARALAEIDATAAAAGRARERVAAAETAVAAARRAAEQAREERDTAARDLGIADWVDRLPLLDDALAVYTRGVAALTPTLAAHLAARREGAAAAERRVRAHRDEERRQELVREAEQRLRRATAERDTLRSAVGAAVEEVLARLTEARQASARLRRETEAARASESDVKVHHALACQEIENETGRREEQRVERDEAVEALRRYALTRLLAVALPQLEDDDPTGWSTTRAVEVARAVEASLADVASDEAAWERNSSQVARHFETLNQQLLAHEYQPAADLRDDLYVVTVPYQGRDCTMAELHAHLAEDLERRRSVLTAREREVIENHLIGEVASHLHRHLHDAEAWVRDTNEELRSRPTSSGMTLRFAWQPTADGPAGLPDARRRLLGTSGTWSPEERTALGAFLQELIETERTRGEGTWREILAKALDYRAWHRFSVERHQDGTWKRLTRRTYGTGSGGEKAIALTLPQFAALAAHYNTAHDHAPRLILLDEAFVGVDAPMRAGCMGLLHAFDLDFIMTSEREWGCYATLPGLAIYQLAARPGIDAVGLTRWVWNGRERQAA